MSLCAHAIFFQPHLFFFVSFCISFIGTHFLYLQKNKMKLSFSILLFFVCVQISSAQTISDSAKTYLQKIHFGMDLKKAKKELGKPLSQYITYGDLRIGAHHNRRQVFVLKYSSDLRLQFNKQYTHFKFNKKAYLSYVRLNDTLVVSDAKQLKDLVK